MSTSPVPSNPHAVIELLEVSTVSTGGKNKTVEKAVARLDSWRNTSLIISVSVELATDKSGEAIIELSDPDYKFIDQLISGKDVKPLLARFWLGFGNELKLGNSLFKGKLVRVEHNVNNSTLRFHDMSVKMKQHKKVRYHHNMTDIALLKRLATEDELEFVAPDNYAEKELAPTVLQYGTNWQFARKIAAESGLRLHTQDSTLFAKEAAATDKGKVAATITSLDAVLLRSNRFSYKLPEHKRGRHRRVEVRGRGRDATRLTGVEESGERGRSEVVVHKDLRRHSTQHAKNKARGIRQSKREHAFECGVRLMPTNKENRINLRETVELQGFGGLFSGQYLVDKVSYDYRAGELSCELNLIRDIIGS